MECAAKCPSRAIEAVGKYVTTDELIAEVMKDNLFYQNSGGGVTLSGGEPLSQWKFALNFLKQCKRENLHTALETCGYARWEVIDRVTEHVDLVLFDIKHMDSAKHEALTGVGNRLILNNAVKVSRKVKTWIRYPVIPGCNDSASEIKSAAAFVAKLPVEKVSLLPYHRMGIQKYERLGREYSLSQLLPPTEEFMENIRKVFESFGLRVTVNE
jgi:pyruvate formate lyase activating enzyme